MSEQCCTGSARRASVLRQVSVFLENRTGTLSYTLSRLADEDVNLLALSIAEAERFGILRLIADDPDAAQRVLDAADLMTREVQVLGIEVPNEPGGLADLLKILADGEIDVHYMYAETSGNSSACARMIMRVEPLDEALRLVQPS